MDPAADDVAEACDPGDPAGSAVAAEAGSTVAVASVRVVIIEANTRPTKGRRGPVRDMVGIPLNPTASKSNVVWSD